MKPTTILSLLLSLLFTLIVASWNAGAVEFQKPSTNFSDLVVNISCTKHILKIGDEIPVELVISNRGSEIYYYYEWKSGIEKRPNDCRLTVTPDATNGFLNLAQWEDQFDNIQSFGSTGISTLHPGECFTNTVELNRFAPSLHPGHFAVTGTYIGNEYRTPFTSAPIYLDILPRTDSEMRAYIGDVTNQFAKMGPTPSRERSLLLEKLAFTRSPEIVPFLLDELYALDDNSRSLLALVAYIPRSDVIRLELVEM